MTDLVLWLFNTQEENDRATGDYSVTLWCLDEAGDHVSVQVTGLKSTFCVAVPDQETRDVILARQRKIAANLGYSIDFTEEVNSTVNSQRVEMLRMSVKQKDQKQVESDLTAAGLRLHDAQMSPLTQLMRDGLSCCSWIKVAQATALPANRHFDRRFRCTKAQLDWESLTDRRSMPQVIRGMGFDIETCPDQLRDEETGEAGKIQFSPDDPIAIIQLTTFQFSDPGIMREYNAAMAERNDPKRGREPHTLPMETIVFAVGSREYTEEIDTTIDPARVRRRCVHWYRTEIEMLWACQRFVLDYKPVIIVGYNQNNFDFKMMATTTKHILTQNKRIRRFAPSGDDPFAPLKNAPTESPLEWSLCGNPINVRSNTVTTAQAGTREKNRLENCNSFLSIDLMVYCIEYQQNRLTQFTLNNVCAVFLGMVKLDVSHDLIAPLLHATDASRRRLVTYGCIDAELVVVLATKLQVLPFYGGLSVVAGPSISSLQNHGQQHLIRHAFSRECASTDPPLVLDYDTHARPWMFDEDAAYKGATVVTPSLGLHRRFVATLDFASLYPSIMISYNICKTSQRAAARGGGVPEGCQEIFCFTSDYDEARNKELDRKQVKKDSKRASKAQGCGDIRAFMSGVAAPKSSSDDSSSFRAMPTVLDVIAGGAAELGTDTRAVPLEPRCFFTKASTFEGTSVRALRKLATYRKAQKKLMGAAQREGRDEDAAIHDGLQKAYKVVMNSLYGFFGAKSNAMYCREVAAAVTATGRGMLMKVIEIVSRHCSFYLADGSFVHAYIPRHDTAQKGGGPPEFFRFSEEGECVMLDGPPPPESVVHSTAHSVIYGDTDSVFVSLDMTNQDFPLDDITERLSELNPTMGYRNPLCLEAVRLCERMCTSVNRYFKAVTGEHSTIDLSYEKLWVRLAIQEKKKYTGLRVDQLIDATTLQYPYRLQMGLDTVRRSTSPFARVILEKVIEHLTYDDTQQAKAVLLDSLRKLKAREYDDFTDFLLTKKWTNPIRKYESNGKSLPIHIHLAKRLIAEGASDRPTIGDRVPHFVVVGSGNKSTRGVSPRELAVQGLDLDLVHYIDLLLNSCAKLFKFWFTTSNCEEEMRRQLQAWSDAIPDSGTRKLLTLFGNRAECRGCGKRVLLKESRPGAHPFCETCDSRSASAKEAMVEIHRRRASKAHDAVLKQCGTCMQVDETTAEGREIISTCFSVKCRLFYKRHETRRRLHGIDASDTPSCAQTEVEDIEDLTEFDNLCNV